MTMSGFSGPACREMRQLLGVYVVGAIDPAERAMVDDHLRHCAECRDELAGLAGLPAMLSRVPAADVEQLSLAPSGLPEMAEAPAEMLNSLLRRVTVKRRSRMWRGAVAVAASAVLAAGTATAVTQLTTGSFAGNVAATHEVARGSNATTGVAAVVDYTATPWHSTAMRVQVSGIKPGTTCQFWVVGKNGLVYAGSWTVHRSYGQSAWYSVSSPASAASVHGFEIKSAGKVLVNIPAS
jgi:predicted anti-sigma-YlaC factor YlaD